MYICFIGKGRAAKVSSTNLLGYTFQLNSSPSKSRRQEDDQVSRFGCPHSFFGRRGYEDPDMYRLINHYTLNKRWNVFRRSSKKILSNTIPVPFGIHVLNVYKHSILHDSIHPELFSLH